MIKKILIGIGVVFLLLIVLMIFLVSKAEKDAEKLENLVITNVDLSQIEDGIYEGKYSIFPVNVVVKVTVQNHQITNIELVKHFNGQGSPAEVIIDEVIENQSLAIEPISGATVSSMVILKAIEIALSK